MGGRMFIAGTILAVLALVPGVALAANGPAPEESCVPGTVWEDLVSGAKYLCIYDELYGGTRWEPLSSGQSDAAAWLARSSTTGCVRATTVLTAISGGGADVIGRSYRWPCAGYRDRLTQPAGELRVRTVIQRFNGGWTTCRDTGYTYNSRSASGWLAGLDMGSAADCGSGSYRAWGFASILQGGAWRGGSLFTPSLYIR